MNVTTVNTTVIDPGDLAYVPIEIWAVMFALVIALLLLSLIIKRNSEIMSAMGTVLAAVTAFLSGYIEFSETETVAFASGNSTVQTVSYIVHPPWLAWVMVGFFFLGIVITWKNIHDLYMEKEGREYQP